MVQLKSIFILTLSFFSIVLSAQHTTYKREALPAFSKLTTITLGDIQDDYQVSLINTETQDASSNMIKQRLIDLKADLAISHPKQETAPIDLRGDTDPPQVLSGYWGHLSAPGIPLDNSLATNGEKVLIAMNSHFAMKSIDGTPLISFSLDHFAAEVGLEGNTFDPRVMYDPEEDRYVAVFLHGNESSDTGIGVMFSQTNDIAGDWAVYALPGNPFSITTWTDYPMINITKDDLIITVNLIRDAEPWETGFDETILWQLDKTKGYAGEDMLSVLWQELEYDGKNIRNLCPMETADEVLESNSYYLSNRNFDVENDTIFFVELSGGINDPNATLSIEVLKTDQPYGFPPNALQSIGLLQTNDARVLEGFYHNDQIQFVGNTRNLTNNKAGIYHGIINNISGDKTITLEHIIPESLEIGYPGITYTGTNPEDLDAIIHFSHTSATEFPGVSALYYLPEEGYSDIIEVREGDGYIDILNGDVERWGDYAGSQRQFDNPGLCLISGTLGVPSKHNRPWVARLAKPQLSVNVPEVPSEQSNLTIYPNPSQERITLDFTIPEGGQHINVDLYNASGNLITTLTSGSIRKTGKSELSFAINHLSSGLYTITINIDDKPLISEQFVKQ